MNKTTAQHREVKLSKGSVYGYQKGLDTTGFQVHPQDIFRVTQKFLVFPGGGKRLQNPPKKT